MSQTLEPISKNITITSFQAVQDSPIQSENISSIKEKIGEKYSYQENPIESFSDI